MSSTNRYVVSIRRNTGLGDHLICLAAAWKFARDTGRILVADWRFSPYALTARSNLFPLCFETPAELAGVPFIGDDSIEARGLAAEPGTGRALLARLFSRAGMRHEATVEAIRQGRDLPQRIVRFDTCVNDGLVRIEDARTVLTALRPTAGISQAVRSYRRGLPPGPVIGLHVRHGNGGNILNHAQFWTSFPSAIDRCARAVGEARRRLGKSAAVMLCTDSIEVEQAVQEQITSVFVRPKMHRHPRDGDLHLWRGAALGREDGLVEMLLLAECDALIRYPPGSFFSFYGAVMNGHRESEKVTIYDLQGPWDEADALSPALIM